MATLENEVRSVVEGFLKSGELFTALDVSNKVKMTFPFARHREVRDLVRAMFPTDIEPAGWNRTDIPVTLEDGSQVTALLYHPLVDSWDLDNKYDAQRRNQAAVKAAPVPTLASLVAKATGAQPSAATAPAAQTVTAPPPPLPAKDQWANLFNSKPSLFPLK